MEALPSHSPDSVRSTRNVVIDFTSFSQRDAISGVFSASALIAWVKSFPRSAPVHVVLPSRAGTSDARQLQSALLSLGCTVTRRRLPTLSPSSL